jgi:hypothetical protein
MTTASGLNNFLTLKKIIYELTPYFFHRKKREMLRASPGTVKEKAPYLTVMLCSYYLHVNPKLCKKNHSGDHFMAADGFSNPYSS